MRKIFITALALLNLMPLTGQTTLTLDEATRLAIQNNRTLRNAALDMQMAGEQKREAYTQYFPKISASMLAFYSFDELVKGDGVIPQEIALLGAQFAPMVGQPFSYNELDRGYTASLSIMQPLYAGGQIRTGNKLADIQRDAMRLQLEMKEKDVVTRVTDAYWQIAQVQYNLQTLDAADRQMSEALKTVQTYVDAGLTQRNDLLKVQLRQQELASNRLKLNNAEHVLRLLLAQMVGMAGEDVNINANSIEPEPPGSVFVNSQDAVLKRPELQLAQKAVEAGQLQVKMERGKHLPTLAVGLMGMQTGFGGLSDNAEKYVDRSRANALVLGTLSVPISAWWGGSHAIRRQKMKLEQARNTALDAREQLQIDIEQAWSNLTEAYDQVGIARQSVAQAEENLRMTADQHRAGTIALADLLDAETLHRKARTTLAGALAAYQQQRCAYVLKTRSNDERQY